MQVSRGRLGFTLFVLFGINFMNFFDRQILGAVAEPIKQEFDLSDTAIGNLGTAFILLYAAVGIPLGRWADFGPRTKILAAGVSLWSVLTAASGFAWNFTSLFLMRLGVGVGEASCAPAATSLLGDLFPQKRRGRAVSVFMFGLPLGLALSFIISGRLAGYFGDWRPAFFVAGLPGIALGLMALFIPEPARGTVERLPIGVARRPGSPVLLVLKTPTMAWIILSGALHNFNMYAIGTFIASFLVRYHGLGIGDAGLVSGVVYGLGGGLGILLGGWACDRMVRRRISGRLEVGVMALAVSVPCIFLALQADQGEVWTFGAWMLTGCSLLYVYYASVYATIQDIIEPALRGTAMALYFFAMYLVGGALGPVATGWASDFFAHRAAEAAGSVELTAADKAVGLHHAMYLIPALGILLVLVMLAASRTVTADYKKLQKWIEATTAGGKDTAEIPAAAQ